MLEHREVNANLVSASGFEHDFEQGCRRKRLERLVVGHRRLSVIGNRELELGFRMPSNRRIDGAARWVGVTLHDGVPVPKVIDFGIAKATQQPLTDKTIFTRFQQFMGTPAYMSPEQARGKSVDKRADIWSFGVLLYELLTGESLFQGEDSAEILAAVNTMLSKRMAGRAEEIAALAAR